MKLTLANPDPNQQCACSATTREGEHPAAAYCTSEVERAYAEAMTPCACGEIRRDCRCKETP